MNKQAGFNLIELAVALPIFFLLIGATIGWVLNIVKIFDTDAMTWLVLRLVGVVIPVIGAILGYIPV